MRARAAVAAAFLVVLGGMLLTAYSWPDGKGRPQVGPPRTWSGDEVHYLMIVNSLLLDRDLELQDDYRLIALAGASRAGVRFRGATIDHHTVLVDPRSGEHALWTEVYDMDAPLEGGGFRRLRPGFEGSGIVEMPAHPVGFPVLAAAFVAATGAARTDIEPRVVWFVVLCGWGGGIVTYLVARRAGLGRMGALGAAMLLVASPWLLYSRSFFGEVPAGLALALALAAMQRDRPAAAGVAVVAAMAMKPSWALVAAGWIVLELLARRRRHAAWLAAVVGAGGLGLIALDLHLAGTPVIGGNLRFKLISGAGQLASTLIDWRQGLLPHVPWVIAGAVAAVWSRPRIVKLVVAAALPNLLLFMGYHSLGGTDYACRYWVPLLPMLAVATAVALAGAPRPVRALGIALGVATAVLAIAAAPFYTEVWNRSPVHGLALLLDRIH